MTGPVNRATQRRIALKEGYANDREARVDAEQRRLIHAAGTPERHLVPRWAAVDRFDPVRTRSQAERIVRDRHERLLGFVDRAEAALLRPLVREAQGRLRDGLPGLFELNARPGPVLGRKGPTMD